MATRPAYGWPKVVVLTRPDCVGILGRAWGTPFPNGNWSIYIAPEDGQRALDAGLDHAWVELPRHAFVVIDCRGHMGDDGRVAGRQVYDGPLGEVSS